VETEVGELAEMIRKMVGSRSRVVYRPMPVDDPRRRRPDIERAQTLLRWRPRVRLRKGLRETISFFRSEIERGAAGEGLRLTA
jgi:UDP-glucuronate decarboxylase